MTVWRRAWAFERGRLWALGWDAFGQRHSAAPPRAAPRVAATFKEVRRDLAEPLAEAMGLPDPEPLLRRLAAGRRCFVAWVRDEIASYCSVSMGTECIGELEREFRMQAGAAYIWDRATLPSYRCQGLYSWLLSEIVTELRDEGLRRLWIGSSLGNRPSIRGFVSAGFQPVVTVAYLRAFKLRCVSVIGCPGAPERLVADARRALTAPDETRLGFALIGLDAPEHRLACGQADA